MVDMWDDGEPTQEDFALPGDEELFSMHDEGEPAEEAEAEPEGRTDAVTDEEASEADAASGRPRDERGRYVAQEPAEAAEETEEAEPDPDRELLDRYLSKYDGDEAQALKAAANQDSLLGRQAQELGELRAQQAQMEQYLQMQQMAQAQAQRSSYPTDWETLIDEDPAAATKLAYEQGNETAYQAAAQAWEELSPGTPRVWYDNEQMKGALGQLAQVQQQQQSQEQRWQMAQRADELVRQYPDLPNALEEMSQIAPKFPYELRALVNGTPQEALAATESLYLKARALKGGEFAQKAQEIARSQTEEEMRVREGASVASASRTHTEPPLSPEERIAADWGTRDKLLAEGWNV